MVQALDPTPTKEVQKESPEIIETKYWHLPVEALGSWRPSIQLKNGVLVPTKEAVYIDYRVFVGPEMGVRDKGLNLHKDMMGGFNGPRGGCKSISLTFFAAKKMVVGWPAWTNYPISFFVIWEDGRITYHESMPIEFEKFYKFKLKKGVVGITELQYYVEARTSGRLQNRMASYNIMQLRKECNSFYYDVQDQTWVDKRFGWSDDFNIECRDVARMNYEGNSLSELPQGMLDQYGNLQEGAIALWSLRDISGALTGERFKDSHIIYDNIQFDAWYLWNTFPTHFIIDAYDAMHSLKTPDDEAKAEEEGLTKSLESAINEFLLQGFAEVRAIDLWEKTATIHGKTVNTRAAGGILKKCQIPKRQRADGNYYYNIGALLNDAIEAEAKV